MFVLGNKVNRFHRLLSDQKWKEAAILGEKLLRKDPDDGVGIRFGVMDAYAVLGDVDAAIDLGMRYCDYCGWEDTGYRSGEEISRGWSQKEKETWMETVDTSMQFQLAMALWKNRREEEARRILDSMPAYLLKYLTLNEKGLEREKARVRAQYFLVDGTVDMLVGYISIPYQEQIGFRKWIGVPGRKKRKRF